VRVRCMCAQKYKVQPPLLNWESTSSGISQKAWNSGDNIYTPRAYASTHTYTCTHAPYTRARTHSNTPTQQHIQTHTYKYVEDIEMFRGIIRECVQWAKKSTREREGETEERFPCTESFFFEVLTYREKTITLVLSVWRARACTFSRVWARQGEGTRALSL